MVCVLCVLSALVVFELSALVWCWCLYGCSGGVCIEWIGVVMVYSGEVLLRIVCIGAVLVLGEQVL